MARLSPIQLPNSRYRPRASAAGTVQTPPDMTTVNAALADLQTAVTAFRAENDARLAALEKGKKDVVQDEKVDRAATEVVALQRAVETMSAQLAAVRVGGAGAVADQTSEAVRAHTAAFETWFRRGTAPADMRALEVNAALSTDSNADGGYIVPEAVELAITRVVGLRSAMRQVAKVQPIGNYNYKKHHNLGGSTAGWVGERGTRSQTNTPTLAELNFPAATLYAMPAATEEMLDDARISVEQWLADEVSITFAEQEGAAFISGDGMLKPDGVLGTRYTKVANASYAWGKLGYIASGVAAALTDGSNNGFDALKAVVFGLNAAYRVNAQWMLNDATQLVVSKIKDTTGQYIWQQSVQVGQPSSLFGYPVTPDDNMPDIAANAYPISFGDFQRGYLIVDRAGTVVLRDPFTSKGYILFYTRKRVGGGVQDFAAIKLVKIATS